MTISTVSPVANNNNYISGKVFSFDINVQAYMKNEVQDNVLRKDQDISIELASCDRSCA